MVGVFERIANAVIKQIQQNVIDNEDQTVDEEDRPMINLTAFLNDFGNQDFLDKNVRVRPVSGMTRGENDETKTNNNDGAGTTTAAGKSLLIGGDAQDDEEKFNRMINLDMEEQRKNIKLKRDEAIRKKQIEEEKKLKKKNKD
jgi:hypothetical protein